MTVLEIPKKKPPSRLLHAFIYGSLIILLACLFSATLVFSVTYLKKEQSRADISSEQLSNFFSFQYRLITEEMWTQSYESINMRVADIAKQLGHASYDLVLTNEAGHCVYATGVCATPDRLRAEIPNFQTTPPKPILRFDNDSNRYVYMIPLFVGAVQKGYLYATLSDPYDFYRGGSVALALKMFIVPIGCVILAWLLWLLISNRMILRPYLSSLVQMEKRQALGVLAAQVAHDIRSPLVTLKSVIGSYKGFDSSQRRLINTAAGRIENIANDLITQFSGRPRTDGDPFSFVSSVVDSIVAEKRALLGEASEIEIRCEIPDSLRNTNVPISATELSRILSNLLNNAIDALKQEGTILITMIATSGRVHLSVHDDGPGIPSETLHKLKTVGGSYGKSAGTGIGLQHAKATLSKAGGALIIDSEPKHGTTVTLEMPTISVPKWCLKILDLSDAKTVVVLEDDPSVHLLWKKRLGETGVVFLSDPEQFDISRFPPDSTRYIFDHEICGSPVTGLDLIVSHKLGDRAVLVTSYFNEPRIQKTVEQAEALMLPKFMISTVEIQREPITPRAHNGPYDVVLIDDDPMVHDLWQFSAAQRGKVVKTVTSASFLDLAALDRTVPIYVDKNLGRVSGLTVASDLHEKGFSNISITTGESLDGEVIPQFIRGIANKDFPAEIFGHVGS